MLPYFTVPKLTHYVLLAAAVLLGHGLQRYRARRMGLDDREAGTLSLVLVVGAAFGAHWLQLAQRGALFSAPLPYVFFPYGGGVALGGLGGGFLAAAGYARWKRLPLRAHLTAAAWAFPPAWAVLRLGCFLAHDTLGKPYTGPLALAAPEGPRHDLAFYEIVWAGALTAALAWRPANPIPKLLLSYGILRAILAPLRADPSLLDWAGAAVLLAAGAWGLREARVGK